MWIDAAKKFEENSHSGVYFETKNTANVIKQIYQTIDKTFPQMIFLLGEPGSGKTFLINHLAKKYKSTRHCLLIENPFLSPMQLLDRMLSFAHVNSENTDVETKRLQAIKAYENTPHLIIIDEAQLTSLELREFIRILSDSKVFWFLLAMHTKEGDALLKTPHFYSRAHKKIYMGVLQKKECLPFLQQLLTTPKHWDFIISMGEGLIEKSWNLTNGNFRNFKKLYYHLFLLVDFAEKNNHIAFAKPSKRLLQMAALKAGLVSTKANVDNFDELLEATKNPVKSNKKLIARSFIAAVIIILLLIIFYLLSKENQSTINQSTKTSNKALHVNKQNQIKQNETIQIKKDEQKIINQTPKNQIQKNENISQNQVPINTTSNLHANETKQKNKQEVKQETKQEKKQNEILKYYPPSKKTFKPKEAIKEPSVVDSLYANNVEPVFLDEKVKEQNTKKTSSILSVNTTKASPLSDLLDEFNKTPVYENALALANMYYNKKDYEEATLWAKKANKLDNEQEEAWILFAKSKYMQGQKKEAISVLRLFLNYKSSNQAQQLLKKWNAK